MLISAEDCQYLSYALSLEWLETNGRGGFASGTVAGANTRRYHALLLVARRPPGDRVVLVNQLEEWLDLDGESVSLSTNCYPGVVHPAGYRHSVGFALAPWPRWTYHVGKLTITREVVCMPGRDLVVLRWRVTGPPRTSVALRVRPKLTGRDYHALHRENSLTASDAVAAEGEVSWQPYHDLPAVRAFHSGVYRHAPEWYRRIQFPCEQERGLEFEEDWWSPGEFTFVLRSGRPADVVLSIESEPVVQVEALLRAERNRRRIRTAQVPSEDPLVSRLWQATEAFLSLRDSRQSIVAGYPWFTDWGRDTFIALPGL